MGFSNVVLILVCVALLADCSKYSEEKNKDKDDQPFRMMKVNLIWNKAKMRLPKEDLTRLYQALKHQDQLETDLKKKKASGQDDDGEFEALVRRKFLDVMISYGLESIHPDSPPTLDNEVYQEKHDAESWQKVMGDRKLSKLWKKAQLGGFTDRELGALRSEFLHHVDKLDEMNILHSTLNELDKEAGNSIADFNEKQEKKYKNVDLKNKHRQLRDNFDKLEATVTRKLKPGLEKGTGGFKHPKVIDLWFSAKNSNFTDEELESIREELGHFEHKVKKLEHLEDEHIRINQQMDQKNMQLSDYPEKKLEYAEKVSEYTRKVKKYETDLRERINKATRHNEL